MWCPCLRKAGPSRPPRVTVLTEAAIPQWLAYSPPRSEASNEGGSSLPHPISVNAQKCSVGVTSAGFRAASQGQGTAGSVAMAQETTGSFQRAQTQVRSSRALTLVLYKLLPTINEGMRGSFCVETVQEAGVEHTGYMTSSPSLCQAAH